MSNKAKDAYHGVGFVKGKAVIPDWLGKAPDIKKSEIAETIVSDIVVCGGGHAGLNVARAAAAGGASVSVIEKQTEKGYKFLGEQIGHFNSHWLLEHGIPRADVQDIVAEFQKRSANRSNASLIRQYVSNSGEMFDSLINLVPKDHNMLKVANIHLSGDPEQTYPIERGGYKTWAGNVQFRKKHLSKAVPGIAVHSYLTELNMFAVEDAIRHGATWYFRHNCQVLTKNGDRVVGCIAKNGDGKYVEFFARKGVVLCCGDFSANNKMVIALMDEVRDLALLRREDLSKITGLGRDGIGQRMGCWAGGYMEPGPRAALMVDGLGGSLGLTAMLALNCHGERFCNETITVGIYPAINRQPLGMIVGLFDAKWLDYIRMDSVDHGQPDFGVPVYLEQVAEDMVKAANAGARGYAVRNTFTTERKSISPFPVYAANNLKELADYLGYTGKAADNFLSSIKRYNELCEKGYDDDFGKEKELLWPLDKPPYFAMKSDNLRATVGLVTLSGLVTDNNQQVISADGATPIAGLYASGNCCGQRYALAYSCPVSGNSIGIAMTLGRVLGKYLAML